MRILIILLFIIFFQNISVAQKCKINVTGFVLDEKTNAPLPFSTIYLENIGQGTVTDETGFFEIKNICAGEYHLRVSHIGCAAKVQFVGIKADTLLKIYLNHHSELLNEIVVEGSKGGNSTESSQTISRAEIVNQSNKNLSDILENMTGVSVLKSGSGISKPVIHGLYGNRISIINNGISQSGQQWGNDHAPEIDPFVANNLSVIKGASALAYGGNSLGGIVLVEPERIQDDPHLHGTTNYVFQTNGRGHTVNSMFSKNGKLAAWRISGTWKKKGDGHTPNYFLTNTGSRENNVALQIEKKFNQKIHSDFYYSFFQTKIGVLRGSHIGNLTDLKEAIGREQPFYTEDKFSYNIALPRQDVKHHLVKVETKYFLSTDKIIKFKYGGQLNQRQEFDVRRGNSEGKPSLSLALYSHQFELTYTGLVSENLFFKSGIQFEMSDNGSDEATGISPLIPNYRSHQTSAFGIFQLDKKRNWVFEFGGRYSWRDLTVKTFTESFPRELEVLNHTFHKYAFSAGTQFKKNKKFSSKFNLGYLLRAPEVNEMYSFGLHQGVSGIEEGQRDLETEKSLKATWSLDYSFGGKWFVQALGYVQHIQDYIFLEPQEEFRLTIRGAFPVFIYQQTNANIAGVDFLLKYEPTANLKLITKYSHIKGIDLKANEGLINIPSNNAFAAFTYLFRDGKKWKNNSISINARHVFRQNRISESQDFLSPPDEYTLLGLEAGTSLEMKNSELKISLRFENLLNQKYRDYLNRQRYFADELGRNISLNLNFGF